MKRLAYALELLDGPIDDPRTLRDNLRDLRRINRLLGGVGLSRAAVRSLADGQPDLSLIDVGTGAADIPLALVRSGVGGRRVSAVAVDSRNEVLEAARSLEPALDRTPGLRLRLGDGRELEWPDRAFDVAHSSLVLHHLEPGDAVSFLRELGRVSRRGVVVNDLRRAWPCWAGARVGTPLVTAHRFTRTDAPLSVARAFSADDWPRLGAAAGLDVVARRTWAWRWAVSAVPR